ncbi:MAG: alpha/beta fold hydrolase [Thermoanaerobaculia bacterium]
MTSLPDVLAHRVEGEGEPLLLLNGGMMSMGAWRGIVAALRPSFTVVCCDFRGQLLSPGPPSDSMEGHADDVARLLDHLGIPRAHVAGASFGAYAALLLAARHPTRVTSIVAAAVTDYVENGMAAGDVALRAACERALAGGDRGAVYDLIVETAYSPAWREAHRGDLSARRGQIGRLPDAWFSGLLGLLSALSRCDLRPVLGRIASPVLVLAAGADAIMPFERTESVAKAILGAELRVLPECGHAISVEREEEFVRLTSEFAARADRSVRAS